MIFFIVSAIDSTYTFMPQNFWFNKTLTSSREHETPPMEAPPLPKQPVINPQPVKGILKKPMPIKYI